MSVIFLLIPLSIATATVFLVGFIWAVRSGQYEDTCTPALRLLTDDSNIQKLENEEVPAGNKSSANSEQVLPFSASPSSRPSPPVGEKVPGMERGQNLRKQ
jgi:cbb3-type cytochrome oxidase maturation protein